MGFQKKTFRSCVKKAPQQPLQARGALSIQPQTSPTSVQDLHSSAWQKCSYSKQMTVHENLASICQAAFIKDGGGESTVPQVFKSRHGCYVQCLLYSCQNCFEGRCLCRRTSSMPLCHPSVCLLPRTQVLLPADGESAEQPQRCSYQVSTQQFARHWPGDLAGCSPACQSKGHPFRCRTF